MRMEQPDLEEIQTNFEEALKAAEKGQLPSTDLGFDGRTFQALVDLAKAADGKRASRIMAARRTFADQLAGVHLDEDVQAIIAGA